MKHTNTLVVGMILAVVATFAAPSVTYAACSANGYYNSNSKCGVSYKVNRPYQYTYYNQYNDARIDMLTRYIEQLRAMIERLEEQRERLRDYDYDYNYDNDDVEVTTRSAVDIETDEATLRGYLDLNDADDADVWFEYGTSRSDLDEDSNDKNFDDNEYFSITIDDLDEDTRYYYRAVAKDEDGDKDYGAILSFRTDGDSDNDDEPVATTYSATDIDDDSAKLRGYVDMNDFNNGEVFFVYGEDEEQLDDIEDDYDSYDDVDEDGDDLQKERVDSDLDGAGSYSETVSGLDDNTDIYFRICVGYEDEDDDEVLACGSVRSFETD